MIEPQPVSDVMLAFPAGIGPLMPEYESIPNEFKGFPSNKWNNAVNKWFFGGTKGLAFWPKEGIDPEMAIRHIACILGSYEPKHEHKDAACAYLMSLWFDDVVIENSKDK